MVAVAAGPEAERLFVAGRGGARLVDGTTGETLATFSLDGGYPVDVAVSPTGRWAAAGTLDGTLRVWDAATGTLRLEVSGHDQRIASVAFGDDDEHLVTGSWDGSARIWDLSVLGARPEDLVERAELTWGLDLEQALTTDVR